jgi:DNA-binding beta-propeller fold protein YncE
MTKACVLFAAALIVTASVQILGQAPSGRQGRAGGRGDGPPVREYPRPDASAVRSRSGQWKVSDDWATLPAGVKWGVTSAATSDASGKIYVIRREQIPIFVFEKGKLVKQFGQGLYTWPHGIRVDREGYLWTVDGQDNVIYKMDMNQGNKILLTLGTRGVTGEGPNSFNRPTDIAFAPNGDFFISDGYGNSRVVKYSKDGRFVKTWGTRGTAPGQFNLPHTIVLDSKNRVLVGDRSNSRVQVFDMDGTFLEMWTDLGAPYGLAIAKDDTLYVSDAEAGTITVSKNGKVLDLIENLGRPHLIGLDPSGAIYMADVRAERVRKIYRAGS